MLLPAVSPLPSQQLHPQTLSSLNSHLLSCTPSIAASLQQLPLWYTTHGLKFHSPRIPRLQLLSALTEAILQNVPDPKYINTLFLEEEVIVAMVGQCEWLADVGYVLGQHLGLKKRVKAVDYSEGVMTAVKARAEELLKENTQGLDALFGVRELDGFLEQKAASPDNPYNMFIGDRLEMEREAIVIFNYVLRPIFEKKSFQNVYELLYPMIKWFIVIRDDEIYKQDTLRQMVSKINSFLWAKKTTSNVHLLCTFNMVMELLSVKYVAEDSFSCYTLAPLLLKLKDVPFSELVNNWLSTQQHQQKENKALAHKMDQVLRNTLNMGCMGVFFPLLEHLSKQLQSRRDYDSLFHLFNTLIRKQYLSIRQLDMQTARTYMDILLLYTVGFINRDRLDGETELDRLAVNLSELVLKPKFKYDTCYMEIIKFFKIYENRFQYLSTTCRNLLRSLEMMYRVTLPVADIYNQVAKRVFRDYSADYQEEEVYSLQRTSRYAGLENLGNTCYMNSYLQALFMTKKFSFMVCKAKDEGVASSAQPLFEALVRLFGMLSAKNIEHHHEINATFFKQKVPEPFRSSWEQHDSEQFGRMLLDNVTSQLKGTPLADKINRLFTHELQQKIICKGCTRERKLTQKQIGFILQFDEKSPALVQTISDLFRSYFGGYELDQHNMIMCDRCRKNSPAFVIPQPVVIAEYLIATLSIFRYDQHGSSKTNKKINLQFSLNLRHILPKLITGDQIYELYAFILHIGTGVERGHYQCFARNLEENPMLWYKFDDHYVTQMEINQMEDFHFGDNETPYILFYVNSNKNKSNIRLV